MSRFLSLIPLTLLLTGCPPGGGEDYFRLDVGNTWEYFLVDGGVEGEYWTLSMLDADENEESGRGDVFFQMLRTVPDALGPGVPADYPQRRFNVALEEDTTGSVAMPIGWTYRWLPDAQKEGDRGEYFVKSPGSASDWSDGWSYEVGDAGSDFDFEVETYRSSEARQTSFGTYTDLVIVERTTEITSYSTGTELVQTTTSVETWAAGVGLIHFSILGADGVTTEAVLRTTNAADSPGT